MSAEGDAINCLLAGLIDYAGLYPPASLDLALALANYRAYRTGKHGFALARFIIDVNRIDELRALPEDLRDVKLSAILSKPSDWERVSKLLDDGALIESVDCKAAAPEDVSAMVRARSREVETYFEIPLERLDTDILRAISDQGARIKLRMGGVVPEAFPSTCAVARALAAVVRAGLGFKATAGLHHPLRSSHPLTYARHSPAGLMHGFTNLLGAAALLLYGGGTDEAERVLAEEDRSAWALTADALAWRSHSWSGEQLSQVRMKYFLSFGSCSFEEPMRDLEALGWL